MYALSEPPRSQQRTLRLAGTSPRVQPTRPIRLRPQIYRRRRLVAAAAAVIVATLAVAIGSGAADRSVVERLTALVMLAGWVVAAVALSRWDHRTAPSGAGPRATCLALGPAPDLH